MTRDTSNTNLSCITSLLVEKKLSTRPARTDCGFFVHFHLCDYFFYHQHSALSFSINDQPCIFIHFSVSVIDNSPQITFSATNFYLKNFANRASKVPTKFSLVCLLIRFTTVAWLLLLLAYFRLCVPYRSRLAKSIQKIDLLIHYFVIEAFAYIAVGQQIFFSYKLSAPVDEYSVYLFIECNQKIIDILISLPQVSLSLLILGTVPEAKWNWIALSLGVLFKVKVQAQP